MKLTMGASDRLSFTFDSEEGDSLWGILHFYIGGTLVSDPNCELNMNLLRFAQDLERKLKRCGTRELPNKDDSWEVIWNDLRISCWSDSEHDDDDEYPIQNACKFSILDAETCFDDRIIFLVEQPDLGVETYLIGPTKKVVGESLDDYLAKVEVQSFPYGSFRDFVETVLGMLDTSKF